MSVSLQIPGAIEIPAAWVGDRIRRQPQKWRWNLSAAETFELERAAGIFLKRFGSDVSLISPDRFELPSLAPRIATLRETLINGIGFEVISGVPTHDEEVAALIFCGIGAHLGNARPQNAASELLGHVRDLGADSQNPDIRIYQTNERQTFHTDSADVVGLLCLNEARRGGRSLLVSAATIFNELRCQRPDLLKYLFGAVATDRRGEAPAGAKPFFRIPVFSWYAGHLTVMYQRQYIDSAQRFAEAPRLTDRHIEALDFFDRLANDSRVHFSMRLRPGDMQFVYNHNLLHDRTGFTDWPETTRRRHLLRLWLAIPGDRPLPACFAERYGSVEIGNRGGVNL